MKNLTPDDAPLTGGPDELAALFVSARGSEQAAAELYARCQPLLAAWLRRRFPVEIAMDAAHDALAAAFAGRDAFQAGRPLLPWIKTLAFREALDAIRREERRVERERIFAEGETLAGAHRDTERCADGIASGLARLSAKQRNLIERRYLAGESSEAIAKSEGRKRSAVAVELHRICKTLRRCVGALHGRNGTPPSAPQ